MNKGLLKLAKDKVAEKHGYADWFQIDMTDKESFEKEEIKASLLDEVALEAMTLYSKIPVYPKECPVTGRPFFMELENNQGELVPTYGGPFDSYTIPVQTEDSDDILVTTWTCERYDHDEGAWVGSTGFELTKTGIELISIERQEQIEKHGRTIEKDITENSDRELIFGAISLLSDSDIFSEGWDNDICKKMMAKTPIEKLIVAGALIAAEIDRLKATEDN